MRRSGPRFLFKVVEPFIDLLGCPRQTIVDDTGAEAALRQG
jgi:hypothetical protein